MGRAGRTPFGVELSNVPLHGWVAPNRATNTTPRSVADNAGRVTPYHVAAIAR